MHVKYKKLQKCSVHIEYEIFFSSLASVIYLVGLTYFIYFIHLVKINKLSFIFLIIMPITESSGVLPMQKRLKLSEDAWK